MLCLRFVYNVWPGIATEKNRGDVDGLGDNIDMSSPRKLSVQLVLVHGKGSRDIRLDCHLRDTVGMVP